MGKEGMRASVDQAGADRRRGRRGRRAACCRCDPGPIGLLAGAGIMLYKRVRP